MSNKKIEDIVRNYTQNSAIIKNINSGYASQKWIIENEEEKMFLKELKNISQERAKFISYVQEEMKEFSPMIISDNKKRKFIEQDNSIFMMFEFIDGKQIHKKEINLEEMSCLGAFLGKIHKKMEYIKIPHTYSEKTSLKITYNTISEMNNLVECFQKKGNMQYANIIRYKIDILNSLKKEDVFRATQELKKQIVHGDFYIDNILTSNGKYYLMDFDQTGFFYKMYEVIRGMMMIAYDENYTLDCNIKRSIQFLNGYKKENILENMNESIDLYIFILANSMYCLREEDFYDENKRKFALTRYNMLKWIYDNKKILLKNFEKEIEDNEATI